MARTDLLQLYGHLGSTTIPVKPRSKELLVNWSNGCNPTAEDLQKHNHRQS